MGGNIQAQVDDLAQGAQRFISIQATADYDLKASIFSGQEARRSTSTRRSVNWLSVSSCAREPVLKSASRTTRSKGRRYINLRLEDAGRVPASRSPSFDAAGGTGFQVWGYRGHPIRSSQLANTRQLAPVRAPTP